MPLVHWPRVDARLRVSELIAVGVAGAVLETSPYVHLRGKGRKQRAVLLWKSTVQEIRIWPRRNPTLGADAPLLPNKDGTAMTRSNVNKRSGIAAGRAAEVHPGLAERRISPHWIRHSTAMHMRQSGVAFSVIALWLGHENTTTIHRYVEADLAMKDKALARRLLTATPIPARGSRESPGRRCRTRPGSPRSVSGSRPCSCLPRRVSR